jgi:hypothetical protein
MAALPEDAYPDVLKAVQEVRHDFPRIAVTGDKGQREYVAQCIDKDGSVFLVSEERLRERHAQDHDDTIQHTVSNFCKEYLWKLVHFFYAQRQLPKKVDCEIDFIFAKARPQGDVHRVVRDLRHHLALQLREDEHCFNRWVKNEGGRVLLNYIRRLLIARVLQLQHAPHNVELPKECVKNVVKHWMPWFKRNLPFQRDQYIDEGIGNYVMDRLTEPTLTSLSAQTIAPAKSGPVFALERARCSLGKRVVYEMQILDRKKDERRARRKSNRRHRSYVPKPATAPQAEEPASPVFSPRPGPPVTLVGDMDVDDVIDLHGCTEDTVVDALRRRLLRLPVADRLNVGVITGRGRHSKHAPVLLPLVEELLEVWVGHDAFDACDDGCVVKLSAEAQGIIRARRTPQPKQTVWVTPRAPTPRRGRT